MRHILHYYLHNTHAFARLNASSAKIRNRFRVISRASAITVLVALIYTKGTDRSLIVTSHDLIHPTGADTHKAAYQDLWLQNDRIYGTSFNAYKGIISYSLWSPASASNDHSAKHREISLEEDPTVVASQGGQPFAFSNHRLDQNRIVLLNEDSILAGRLAYTSAGSSDTPNESHKDQFHVISELANDYFSLADIRTEDIALLGTLIVENRLIICLVLIDGSYSFIDAETGREAATAGRLERASDETECARYFLISPSQDLDMDFILANNLGHVYLGHTFLDLNTDEPLILQKNTAKDFVPFKHFRFPTSRASPICSLMLTERNNLLAIQENGDISAINLATREESNAIYSGFKSDFIVEDIYGQNILISNSDNAIYGCRPKRHNGTPCYLIEQTPRILAVVKKGSGLILSTENGAVFHINFHVRMTWNRTADRILATFALLIAVATWIEPRPINAT